ncbi:hypothetical protein EMPG_15550 [Blastomyces silverae]|uniref:Uncharacterized protein n=1 Tax=Blastomyces silverae TaxID=2060906 RepID=A0A0H1BC38_9EURO|nr:hypothetical protein EMPG_15550 [Blastomyces silverae]
MVDRSKIRTSKHLFNRLPSFRPSAPSNPPRISHPTFTSLTKPSLNVQKSPSLGNNDGKNAPSTGVVALLCLILKTANALSAHWLYLLLYPEQHLQ